MRVLPTQYIFYLSRPVIWTGRGDGYGISGKSHNSQFVLGAFWEESTQYHHHPQAMDKICGWHICHSAGGTKGNLPGTYQ